jgi:hypothetical protein
MWKRLITRRGTVPSLIVARRVIEKMVRAGSQYVEDETGEAMIGLIMDGDEGKTYVVLDTISPAENVVREGHTFQQGDGWQDDMIWWYQDNWEKMRKAKRGRFRWDSPLWYLGDWHKQPGYMIAPSGGDLQTALDWLDDDETNETALLVPILTLDHPATIAPGDSPVNYTLAVDETNGTAARVDWWYVDKYTRMFQPMAPVVKDDDDLPALPAAHPWHLADEDRYLDESRKLEDAGFAATVTISDADGKLPLEICFSAARTQGGGRIYLIATHPDYPQSAPELRLMAFVSMTQDQRIADLFPAWWKDAERAKLPPDFAWTPEKTLVDLIQAAETHMGLAPTTEGTDG